MPQFSPSGGPNWVAWSARPDQLGPSWKRPTTKITSASPVNPKTRSRVSNLTRHNATHNTMATSGTQTR